MRRIITIFGSSDITEKSTEYRRAFELGALLGKNGFDIATGGYEGIMKAVSEGASFHSVRRIGILTDDLPHRTPNSFNSEVIKTKDYFERLRKLVDIGSAYIAFDGSWGTMLEICAIISLSKRNLLNKKMICVAERWKEIIYLVNRNEAIDNTNIIFTNDFNEIIKILKD